MIASVAVNMEHIGTALSTLVQEMMERESARGREDRAFQLEEAALSSVWFQPSEFEFNAS